MARGCRAPTGALPASLERLCLIDWSLPLTTDMWPPHLKALYLFEFDQPLQACIGAVDSTRQ